jgi:poly-gamma-glutamate capsule biosynthesis protein CapA/YwtB (metallophosphatase superfamily)
MREVRRCARANNADSGSVTVALTGDSAITMKLSVHREPQFLRLIDILHSASASFTNLEVLFHDYEPYPLTESGGTYMRADPALANDLAWAGFNLVARANNHAADFGIEGMQLTTEYISRAGIVQAGVGQSLREAREAKFLDTSTARFALISTTSTFPDQGRAGESWGDTRARPGLNPLRFKITYVLTREAFDALVTGLRAAGQLPPSEHNGQGPSEITVLGRHIKIGDLQGVHTEPLREDLDAMSAVVRNASRQADYAIVSVHSHESGHDRFTPPEFLIAFAHAMVDAGADIVTTSGPHILRGIELYKGKPIFYSLGNFVFENETLLRLPPENYCRTGLQRDSGVADFNEARSGHDTRGFTADELFWESIVAVPRFKAGHLLEIRLYPITLGFRHARPNRGWPMLADSVLSKKVLADVARLSAPFGTRIKSLRGVGIISAS